MNPKLKAYLQLTRPPNLLTAVSDIWAGIALSGYLLKKDFSLAPFLFLSISSICLYAGGVILNDVYDVDIDIVERPERPIPSGKIPLMKALVFGIILMLIGIALATLIGLMSGLLALLISLGSYVYDRWGKHYSLWGPLNMGLCRGLNLLLGMSILSLTHNLFGWIAIVPVIYIAGVTIISRGEVYGGKRSTIIISTILYMIVIVAVLFIGLVQQKVIITIVFLVFFGLCIFIPLLKAWKSGLGKDFAESVKAGVLGIVLLNASWVATSGNWKWALITILLLPASIILARKFSIT